MTIVPGTVKTFRELDNGEVFKLKPAARILYMRVGYGWCRNIRLNGTRRGYSNYNIYPGSKVIVVGMKVKREKGAKK